ncbi:pyrimidine dimer DNA glycosylase [Thermoplasmatales archaeon SG8-52-1]|nr:MAG: pyrimidine dimer DNA glycosylase [Thermoplasmatales archaeon SG8-52-1]
MRVWDINPNLLCRQHLLGEHREIHAIWSIIIQNKKGYKNHPETKRWKGKLKALFNRHEEIVKEMNKRGYNHKSNLEKKFASGKEKQDDFINSIQEQINLLNRKKCNCRI